MGILRTTIEEMGKKQNKTRKLETLLQSQHRIVCVSETTAASFSSKYLIPFL
jgi:hypothetical protein